MNLFNVSTFFVSISISFSACCLVNNIAAPVDGLVPRVQQKTAVGNEHHRSAAPPATKRHHHRASSSSRRDALKRALLLTTTPLLAPSNPANALDNIEECKSKSHNCIRTTWTAPPSLSGRRSEAANVIRDVLNSYPREGQAGADCNGYRIVKDDLRDESGIIALEYESCVGPAALAINLGRPFVDDLKLKLIENSSTGDVTAEVRSSSRMGSGDLFVNRKRLEFLGRRLRGMGWSVPDPKYVYELK
mmetsp:Transcript_3667/g.9301  ORF Transcript_3667/g.9301 Transcript_3667/m.9301 type:complete len:247 (-) Transcript_3667:51-791(-)